MSHIAKLPSGGKLFHFSANSVCPRGCRSYLDCQLVKMGWYRGHPLDKIIPRCFRAASRRYWRSTAGYLDPNGQDIRDYDHKFRDELAGADRHHDAR